MRILRNIGIFLVVVVVTAAVTVSALLYGPMLLGETAAASDAVVIWPEATTERTVAEPPPRVERFTILAVGDLMTHGPQITSAKTADGYDFTSCFAPVASRVAAADLAIGNLETVLGGVERGYTGYPTFNAPDSYAEALVAAGFDVLTHANNHSLDRGASGLV
ncbi:MAG: CapA family protein, partial [Coriobacteriia bacterium]|nr:CapA family protein [Coriobacteriia bacterium]